MLEALTIIVIGAAIVYGIAVLRPSKANSPDAAIRELYGIAKRDVRYPHAR